MDALGPCELCGHPIYKWQKHERRLKFGDDWNDRYYAYAHENPADHKPTAEPLDDTAGNS